MYNMYTSGRPKKYYPYTGKGEKPPHEPGEYRIRNSYGGIAYIGETNDLRRRMDEHFRRGKLAPDTGNVSFEYKLADKRSTSRTRREHESAKIKQHNPQCNSSKGGEGRIAKRR